MNDNMNDFKWIINERDGFHFRKSIRSKRFELMNKCSCSLSSFLSFVLSIKFVFIFRIFRSQFHSANSSVLLLHFIFVMWNKEEEFLLVILLNGKSERRKIYRQYCARFALHWVMDVVLNSRKQVKLVCVCVRRTLCANVLCVWTMRMVCWWNELMQTQCFH